MGIIVIYFMRPVEEKGTLKKKKMPISVFLELITIFAIEIISRFIIDEFNLLVLKTHTPLAPPTLTGPSLPSIREGCALVGSCLLSEPYVLGEAWLLTLQHTLY